MHRLVLVGLNHTTAPLAIREKIVFSGDQRLRALQAFREKFPQTEAVLLSTCNRVELYAARSVAGHPRVEEMVQFIADFHQLPAAEVSGHLYRKVDRASVRHLFCVASSLDSLVLGETQILGQVREAYELAKQAGSAGALLNPLFQRAIAAGRYVMTQTALGEGRLSVASVAVDYARQIFDHFGDKTVLSIGAGKMAQLVLQHFAALSPRQLLVCNRDTQKAERLAAMFSATPAPFDGISQWLTQADVVISSTGAPHAIITEPMFEQVLRRRRYRPVFLIDIALPRDVEPAVGDLENVYLYNIDDLQKVVAATQGNRVGAVEQARAVVEQQLEEFASWHRAREMGPFIDRLYKRYHEIAMDEVARTLNKLGRAVEDGEREHLEELARRIVNKLLHDPVRTLRHSDPLHGPTVSYLHAMEKLFELGKDEGRGEMPAEKTGE